MSLEAARNLSIPELLCVLNEKLYLEYNMLQGSHPLSAVSTASLETEVSVSAQAAGSYTPITALQLKSLETRAQDVLRLIPSLWNLFQPVTRLPPEILSRIAQCSLCDDAVVDARPIIPLTHVCRYWRESITSDPANWTLISPFSKHLMASTLERAKATALQATLEPRNDLAFHRVLAPYTQNIRTLRFNGLTTIEELTQMLPGFPQSTPSLRSLRLSFGARVVWDQSVDPFESLTPTLRRLEWVDIPLYPSVLRLKSLTVFNYIRVGLELPLDALLDFLEENHSLKSVTLGITFRDDSLRRSRRRAPIKSQLRDLSIHCLGKTMDGRALISGIGLQKGAHLQISCRTGAKLDDILSGVSFTHLSNLRSPTCMEYQSYARVMRLAGPNGQLSAQNVHTVSGDVPFVEFPLLSLSLIQEFRLIHRAPRDENYTPNPIVFDQSFFPALQILAVNCQTSASHLLSALFSTPSSPPSLEILAFLNCDLDEVFMEELTRYASDRKGTTSAQLRRVTIINSGGVFPSVASIRKLEEHVPVVDLKVGRGLPKGLSRYLQ